MIRQSSNEHLHDSEISEVGTSSSSILSQQRHVSSSTASHYSMQLNEISLTDCLSNSEPNSHQASLKAKKGLDNNERNISNSLQQIAPAAPIFPFSKPSSFKNTFSNSPPLVPANSYSDSAPMDVSSSTHQPDPNPNLNQDSHSSVIEKRLFESYSIDDSSSTAAVLGQQSSAHSAPSPPLNQSGSNSSAHNSHGTFYCLY